MLQVYTGNGKGKTTAAIGLAIRSIGAGHRVFMMQFMKGLAYNEQKVLRSFSDALVLKTSGKPYFVALEGTMSEKQLAEWGDEIVVISKDNPPKDYAELIYTSFLEAVNAARSHNFELVILDELSMAMYFGLIEENVVRNELLSIPKEVEVVVTGRKAPSWLIDAADLVSDIREVKHYFNQGIEAREGIEN